MRHAARLKPAVPDRGPVVLTEPSDRRPEAASPAVERLAYRLDEVARALGVSRRLIERQRSAGRFPRPDLTIGRAPLWLRQSLVEWIARGGGRP
jgi:predicted DNA-binding transcriptional regulator AlpA